MLLNAKLQKGNPYDLLLAVQDMVKMYRQTYDEALKLFPNKQEAHLVTANIIQAVMAAPPKTQND